MKIRKVVITGKEQVELQLDNLMESPLQTRELLIETEASFISAGTELAIYTALDEAVYKPDGWCAYPFKSGYANVGMVLDAGEKHRDLLGRRVFTMGPHASAHRHVSSVERNLVLPVPEELSSGEAAAARMALVAMAGLEAAKPQFVRWVVVIGLGTVGNLAAQLFRLTGAQVIGVDPSAQRGELARSCGIPYSISGSETEVTKQVKAITGGHLPDVVVDAVGHSAIGLQAVRLAADGGEVVILGSPRVPVEGNLSEVFSAAHYRWVTIRGALEWSIPAESPLPFGYTHTKQLEAIFRWMVDGRLNLKPLLTHILPPENIKMAYEGLLREKDKYVGVVLKWK